MDPTGSREAAESQSWDAREREALAALRRGERDAVVPLLERHQDALLAFLVALTGQRETAEDVFQETWIAVMEKIDRFKPDRPFTPWLFRIARNRAYDKLRAKRRRVFLSISPDPEEGIPEPPLLDAIDERVVNRDLLARLLAKLPAAQRELLWLRFFEGLSLAEIATTTGARLGTVKTRLHRSLRALGASAGALEEVHHGC